MYIIFYLRKKVLFLLNNMTFEEINISINTIKKFKCYIILLKNNNFYIFKINKYHIH